MSNVETLLSEMQIPASEQQIQGAFVEATLADASGCNGSCQSGHCMAS